MATLLAIVTPKTHWDPKFQTTTSDKAEETIDEIGMEVAPDYQFLWAKYVINQEHRIANAISDFKKYFDWKQEDENQYVVERAFD